MNIVLIIFSFFCLFNIARHKGIKQFLWFMISSLMVHDAIIPHHNGFILAYLVFFLINIDKRTLVTRWNNYPYKTLTLIILCCHIVNIFLNESVSAYTAITLTMRNFSICIFTLFMGYCAIQNEKDIVYLKKNLLKLLYIIALMGVLVGVLGGYNPLLDMAGLGVTGGEKGKLSAFLTMADSHAFSLFVPLLFFMTNKDSKHTIWLSILILLNIVLSTHRAPMIDLILILILAVYLNYKFLFKKYFIYLFALIPIIVIAVSFDMFGVQSKIESVSAAMALTSTEAEARGNEGSSMALRIFQLENAIDVASEKLFEGHGIGFSESYMEELKLNEETNSRGLFGMESYILWLLIDDGIVQGGLILLLYILIAVYLLKRGKFYPKDDYSKAGAIIMIVTLFQLILNRPWGIFEISMPVIGICLFLSQNISLKN